MSIAIYLTLLLLLDAACLGLTLIGLPGNWAMVALTSAFAWWQWDRRPFGWWALGIILGLALLGELFEFLAGAVGTKVSGGSKSSALWALVGGIIGGVVGIAIPVPLVGSLLGACIGAGIGATLAEHRTTGDISRSLRSGAGAGTGRLAGTLAKMAVGVAIWVVVLIAAIV